MPVPTRSRAWDPVVYMTNAIIPSDRSIRKELHETVEKKIVITKSYLRSRKGVSKSPTEGRNRRVGLRIIWQSIKRTA